jgi:DNA-binding response OmpR family regulator
MKRLILQHIDHLLSSALEDEGYSVLSILCSESILDEANRFKPHVILLDFDDKDSPATCKAIKSKFPETAVIALSSNHLIACQHSEYGFNGYVPKPINSCRLSSIIELFCRKNLAKAS